MEHVVFFTESPGEPEFRRVGDLEEAVRLVESLRNERGIADVSVHALTPVPVSFRTYYHVEVGGADVRPAPASTVVEQPVEPVEPAVEEAPGPPVAEDEGPLPEVAGLPEVPELLEVEVPALEVVALEVAALELVHSETDSFGAEFEVPSLEVPSLEVPSLADEAPAAASLALLPPPVEAGPVFELDEPASALGAAASEADQIDEFEALASYEPLVPQVRPEPEPERSLGYFAN